MEIKKRGRPKKDATATPVAKVVDVEVKKIEPKRKLKKVISPQEMNEVIKEELEKPKPSFWQSFKDGLLSIIGVKKK